MGYEEIGSLEGCSKSMASQVSSIEVEELRNSE
jgi:hypothetical protein